MSEEILAEWTATDAEGDGGLPYVPPLAQFGAERETVPGLLAGIELVEGLGAAEIRDGMARIPATAGTGGGETTSAPLAQFNNPYQSDTPGLAAGIIVAPPGESAPSIQDGSFRIPLAQYTIPEMGERPGLIKGSKESEEVTYIEIHEGIIVHPDWVRRAYVRELEKRIEELEKKLCNCSCNITLADIEAAIAEQLGAINWQLETSGLLEENENGRLTVSTTGSGSVDNGAAETQASY